MSGLPPPPPPNAIQPQPNAIESLRAALAAAQQAAGGQPNAFLRPAIGAAAPTVNGSAFLQAATPPFMQVALRNEGMLGAHPPVAAWNQGGQQLGINIFQLSALMQLQHAQNMEMTSLHLRANAAGLEEMKATVKLLVDGHAAALQQTTDRMEKYQANMLELFGKITAAAPVLLQAAPVDPTALTPSVAPAQAAAHMVPVAAPVVNDPVIADPVMAAAGVAAPVVAGPVNAADVAAPAVVRRRNAREPVGDARPPLTRKRAAEANHGGR